MATIETTRPTVVHLAGTETAEQLDSYFERRPLAVFTCNRVDRAWARREVAAAVNRRRGTDGLYKAATFARDAQRSVVYWDLDPNADPELAAAEIARCDGEARERLMQL